MELTFENERIKITAKFYDSMIKLEGRYVFDKYVKGIEKHCVKLRKLKSGKVSCYTEFMIPNGFIYDSLCISDEETKAKLNEWFDNMVKDIAKRRGVEIPKEDE